MIFKKWLTRSCACPIKSEQERAFNDHIVEILGKNRVFLCHCHNMRDALLFHFVAVTGKYQVANVQFWENFADIWRYLHYQLSVCYGRIHTPKWQENVNAKEKQPVMK
jgi:hypothetical protein